MVTGLADAFVIICSGDGHSSREIYQFSADGQSALELAQKKVIKDIQLREQYELNDFTFNGPFNDLDMLYRLQPWDYPNNYLYSDMDETELYMNGDGEIKTKWWLWP